jgi:hypothetical protein
MSRVILLEPVTRRWVCPAGCPAVKLQTTAAIKRGTFDMHICPALNHIVTPLVLDTELRNVNVTTLDREDYEGTDELVHKDSTGRPIMAVNVERRDGSNDRVVFPGTAITPMEATR